MKLRLLCEDIIIFLLGTLLVILKLTNQLNFYVRSDYFVFTFIAGCILIFTGGTKFIWDIFKRNEAHSHTHEHVSFITLAIAVIVITGGFLIPRKPLSTLTAIRRNTQNSLVISPLSLSRTQKQQSSPLLEKADSSAYTIADWLSLFFSDPEPANYIGKSVQVEGFVQPQKDGTYTIARFLVTCCVVDATPISLPVSQQKGDLKADDWIRITGKFDVRILSGKRQLVILPTKIEKIAVPAQPYFY